MSNANARTIRVPKTLYRTGTSEVGADGQIRLSISSDTPYLRYDWMKGEEFFEVLDHGPGGMDRSRLKNGAALLYNHDRNIQLGTVSNPKCEDGRCYVDAKLSAAPDTESYRVRIAEGILKDTSVGYQIADNGEEIGKKSGIPLIKFKWFPHEASMVTIPADISVGAGRTREQEKDEPMQELSVASSVAAAVSAASPSVDNSNSAIRESTTMADPVTPPVTAPAAPVIDVKEVESKAVTNERKRTSDIQELEAHFRTTGFAGHKIDTSELAAAHIKDGKSADEFQRAVALGNFKAPVEVKTEVDNVGMSDKEAKSFRFTRAIYDLGMGRGLQGLEKEASNAHAKLLGVDCPPNSFYVPMDVQRGRAFPNGITTDQIRALFSNVYSGAGAFVGTDLMGSSLIELLRNQMVVVQLGARSLSGLQGNVAIPRQTGGATASWLAEDSTITATQQTVGQLNLTPHKLAAATAFTEQFAMQTSVDAENFVRQDLMAVTAIARDLAAIAGTGVSGQPVGILNLGSANLSTPVTLSAAQSMTYANAVKFELNVSLNNANKGKLAYLTTPTVKNNAKLIAEISSTNSNPVWKDDKVNGYPAVATNQVPTATSVIFGNWDDLILADWATSNFFVDPYSLSLQGQIRVINRLYCDNGVRHGTSFAVSSN